MVKKDLLISYLVQNIEISMMSLKYLQKCLKRKHNYVLKDIETSFMYHQKLLKKIKKSDLNYVKKRHCFTYHYIKKSIRKEVEKDNSDANIASMIVKGYKQGVKQLEKEIDKNRDKTNIEVLSLVKAYLSFLENEINTYIKYIL